MKLDSVVRPARASFSRQNGPPRKFGHFNPAAELREPFAASRAERAYKRQVAHVRGQVASKAFFANWKVRVLPLGDATFGVIEFPLGHERGQHMPREIRRPRILASKSVRLLGVVSIPKFHETRRYQSDIWNCSENLDSDNQSKSGGNALEKSSVRSKSRLTCLSEQAERYANRQKVVNHAVIAHRSALTHPLDLTRPRMAVGAMHNPVRIKSGHTLQSARTAGDTPGRDPS